MKTYIIASIISFVLLTILSIENNAVNNGISTYGFPFTFYEVNHLEAKSGSGVRYGLQPLNLLIDIVVAGFGGFVFVVIKQYWFKRERY